MEYSLEKKLQGFRQIAQEKLQNILCSIPGNQKDLVIEPTVIKSLEHVCGASWLRSKGVNKIYKFDQQIIPFKKSILIYMIPSNLLTFKYVLDQIQKIITNKMIAIPEITELKEFHVIVLPIIMHSFEVLLEEEGMCGMVMLHRFNWDFISIDAGVLSMEITNVFEEVFIKEDTSLLSSIAHSLRIFNMVFKKPPLIVTYGENSEKILDMVERIEGFQKQNDLHAAAPDFNAMILIDRNKDYPSCLLTPVIYSGLLLEIFQSKSGTLQIDVENNRINSEKLSFLRINDTKSNIKKDVSYLRLSGANDSIYQENRYKHFSEVVSLLSSQAKVLGMEGKNLKDMQLNQMHEYVEKKLPKITSQKKELFKHLILCEAIVNELGSQFEKIQTMEESMLYNKNKKQIYSRILEYLSIDAHKYNVLRHICLLHLTCNLTNDEATGFITNYLNVFGYQYLTVFPNLATAKLFPEIENTSRVNLLTNINMPKWQNHFQAESNKLKLLPIENARSSADKQDQVSPSYVFNGSYIPLVAQLADIILNSKDFNEFTSKISQTDQLKLYKYFDVLKGNVKDISAAIKNGNVNDVFPIKSKTIFIFIVGGVTYAEIAACHLIEKLVGAKIVLGSNGILSGCDLIQTAFS